MTLFLKSLRVGTIAAVIVGLWIGAANGQTPGSDSPRTSWGDPDLRGVWDNASTATPWERPAALAGKTSLTDQEVAERQQAENALVAKRESGKDFT